MRRCIVVLLVALTACSHIQPIPRRAEMPWAVGQLPPIPETVPSQLGSVPVVWQDTLVNERGQPLMGGFHSGSRTIYLHSALKTRPAVAWSTLLHEMVHVNLFDAGFRQNTQDVDAFADVISTAVVRYMLARKPP